MKTATSFVASVAAIALAACSTRPAAPPEPEGEPINPTAATAAASVRNFTLGEFSALSLLDGTFSLPNDNKVFGVGRPPADVAAVLAAAALPTDRLELSLQPLLVQTPDRVLLFDAGAGANMGPSAGKLSASMAAAGVAPATITDIFISHSHGDHVGGLVDAAGALAYPNATIHISAAEWEFLKGTTAEQAAAAGVGNHAALIAAITPKVAPFAPDAEIVPGAVKAVDIKGHTPGHSGYLITSGKTSLLYLGDTVHHFAISVRRPDWTIAFDADPATAQESRKALLARSAASGQLIYAFHFPFPGVGKVKGSEREYSWVAR
jgi:glyoxylase-like metal-dependent hydrolase (beta-lactamase superfamily II)